MQLEPITPDKFPPNGGWKFRQVQFNWENPAAMIGYTASVNAIVAVRRQNAALSVKNRLSTDPGQVGAELVEFNRVRLGIPLPVTSSFTNRLNLSGAGVAAVDNLKRAAQGTAVVLDWLTSGGNPVSQELANKRAATCVACPKNVEGSWYTVAPAQIIKSTLEARKDLKLETPSDAGLKSCDVCRCLNRLKVWVPLEHIVSKTKPEVMAEFVPSCWIAKRDQ